MQTPIVILCGQAGSGKDTLGKYLADTYNAVCVAQADPLKRFARNLFLFTDAQLWGSSELRNERDPRYEIVGDFEQTTELLDDMDLRLAACSGEWIDDVLPRLRRGERKNALKLLELWHDEIIRRVANYQGLTPRYALQTLGTEFGRALSPDIWIKYALRNAAALLGGPNAYEPNHGLVFSSRSSPLVVITDGRFRNEIAGVKAAGGITLRIVRPNDRTSDSGGVPGHVSERELSEMPDHTFDVVVKNDGTLDDLYLSAREVVRTFFPHLPVSTPSYQEQLDLAWSS